MQLASYSKSELIASSLFSNRFFSPRSTDWTSLFVPAVVLVWDAFFIRVAFFLLAGKLYPHLLHVILLACSFVLHLGHGLVGACLFFFAMIHPSQRCNEVFQRLRYYLTLKCQLSFAEASFIPFMGFLHHDFWWASPKHCFRHFVTFFHWTGLIPFASHRCLVACLDVLFVTEHAVIIYFWHVHQHKLIKRCFNLVSV